jgi:hypothetical protein
MIFRVDDQVGNGARRQSFQPYPTSTTPPCGGVGWASSPSVPLGTTWLRRDACRLGVTSGRAETGARRIGKGATAMVAADFRSPPLIIGHVHRSGTLAWDVPAVGHRTVHTMVHTIMTIATTMPTPTQASRPHKNQDASRSSSQVKLVIVPRAFEDLHRLDWQHQAFYSAACPKTDITAKATALNSSKRHTFYPALKGKGFMALPIYNCGAKRRDMVVQTVYA